MKDNMTTEEIAKAIEPVLARRGCFLVEARIGKDDDILVAIEKEEGDVSLEDCESINDAFLEAFDRDEHDYSLTVTSAGLDQPFKVPAQFAKATGSTVEVRLKGGMKLVGVLTGADEEGICLRYTVKEVPEGKKKKVAVEHEGRFSFERINSVMPHITFDK